MAINSSEKYPLKINYYFNRFIIMILSIMLVFCMHLVHSVGGVHGDSNGYGSKHWHNCH